jgi:hypothetical protein
MIALRWGKEAVMSGRRWPTIEESLHAARAGILDDSKVTWWPDRETVEAMRKDLAEWRAKRQAGQQNGTTENPAGRRVPPSARRKSRAGT